MTISQGGDFQTLLIAGQIVTNFLEILEFLLSLESIGVTIIESHGGYTNNKNNLLLCVIPTKKYFIIKEGLKQIDKDIFFVVTDSYEVNRRGLDEFI